MKPRHFILFVLTAFLAAAGGWFLARQSTPSPKPGEASGERKILYYQSAMHPWIKSDQPGNCTICGMKLTPVYEGEAGFSASPDVVSLSSNSVTVVDVRTEPVQRRDLVRTLRVAGRIDDNDTRHRFVSAYIDGRIDRLFVNYVGAEVTEGQPLATFYSPPLLTAEREYLALLRAAPSVREDRSIPSAPADLLAGAAQRLKQLGLTEEQIRRLGEKKVTESHSEILAPVSGTVVERFVYEGAYVKEGDKLFEIADFSTMWFLFDAYEQDLAWIEAGAQVEITTPAVPGRVFTAPITFIDPNLSDATRSAKVRVEIPNPLVEEQGRKRRLLSHRLYAEGVVRATIPGVLAAPRSAVLSPGPNAVAYVELGRGTYEQRKLKLGRLGEHHWEVLEGLSEGERVVTAGNLLIDAQAQLNQQSSGTHHAEPGPTSSASPLAPAESEPATPLSGEQKQAARALLAAVDATGAGLAADSLDRFNAEIHKLHTLLPELVRAFAGASAWQADVNRLNSAGHLARASDLAGARQSFLPLSTAAVEFTRRLRQHEPDFAGLKVFQCPMTNRSFPGAPKTARWIQIEGPLRNPYFGSEMLDCGTEVKP